VKITILTDDSKSWFVPYGVKLSAALKAVGHDVQYIFNAKDVSKGDVCFLLSCTRIVKKETLEQNENNIVIHASDLPHGKGFSPLQWQILEGKTQILLTLFEATEEVDAGPFYLKSPIQLEGTELYNELRQILGDKIVEMATHYIRNFENMRPIKQNGAETFYPKRTINDDRLDTSKSIEEQFNHFRIADNEKHPLWFECHGVRYTLKIEKKK